MGKTTSDTHFLLFLQQVGKWNLHREGLNSLDSILIIRLQLSFLDHYAYKTESRNHNLFGQKHTLLVNHLKIVFSWFWVPPI